jgi:hypothetical protein
MGDIAYIRIVAQRNEEPVMTDYRIIVLTTTGVPQIELNWSARTDGDAIMYLEQLAKIMTASWIMGFTLWAVRDDESSFVCHVQTELRVNVKMTQGR